MSQKFPIQLRVVETKHRVIVAEGSYSQILSQTKREGFWLHRNETKPFGRVFLNPFGDELVIEVAHSVVSE